MQVKLTTWRWTPFLLGLYISFILHSTTTGELVEGKHILKSMSDTRTSGGVYNYRHREPTAEQVGLDVQREIEMKTLDIIYLKCRYLLSATIQIEMDNTFLHSGKTYC